MSVLSLNLACSVLPSAAMDSAREVLKGEVQLLLRVPAETPLRALELDHVRGTLGVLAKGKRDVEAARRVLGDYYAKTA